MLRGVRRRRHRRRAPTGPTPRRCCASSACGSAGSEARARVRSPLLARARVGGPRRPTSAPPVIGPRRASSPSSRPSAQRFRYVARGRGAARRRRSWWRSRPSASATSRSSTSAIEPPVERDGRTVVDALVRARRLEPRRARDRVAAGPLPRCPGEELARRRGVTTRVVVASVLGDADERGRHPRHQGPGGGAARLAALVLARRRARRRSLALGALVVPAAARAPRRAAVAPPPRPGARDRRARRSRALRAAPAARAGRVQGVLRRRSRASCARYLEERFARARARR